jgi:SAM-dependent methyltransferase
MRVHAFWHRRMLAMVQKMTGPLQGKSVLEVGIGFGFLARLLKSQSCRYSGVEMNAKLADELRGEGFDVICSAVPPFPPGEAVDVVWMSHVLEHACNCVEARAMVAGAAQRLGSGGKLVLIAPDYLFWRGEFWGADWSHGYPTTLNRCQEIVRDVGLNVTCAVHHTATVRQPAIAYLLACLFLLIPYNLLDALLEQITGRRLAYAFMGLLGWRQILVVAEKSSAA